MTCTHPNAITCGECWGPPPPVMKGRSCPTCGAFIAEGGEALHTSYHAKQQECPRNLRDGKRGVAIVRERQSKMRLKI